MEAAGELIVDAAASHFFEGGFGHGAQMLFAGLLEAIENQVHRGGVRKFRGAPEAAIFDVEELGDRSDLGVDDGGIEFAAGSGEYFGLGDGIGKRIRGALELGALAAIRFGDGEQDAAKTGAAHLIFGRKIRAAEKRAAVGQEKNR